MRIPAWRVALTGGAITVLAVAGIGLATASGASSSTTPTDAQGTTGGTAVTDDDLAIGLAEDIDSASGDRAGNGPKLGRLLRLGRHLVHAEVTVTDSDGKLVNLQLDHGTVQSIGGGTLVISEAGGGTQTVSTSDSTRVRVGREQGDLGDVKVGAEVFVRSLVDGGTTLAKRIIVIPAGT